MSSTTALLAAIKLAADTERQAKADLANLVLACRAEGIGWAAIADAAQMKRTTIQARAVNSSA